MEDIYKMNPLLSCSGGDVVREVNVNSATGASELNLGLVANNFFSDISDRFIKSQIATHPLYPNLVSAYIECRKVTVMPHPLTC